MFSWVLPDITKTGTPFFTPDLICLTTSKPDMSGILISTRTKSGSKESNRSIPF